MARFYTNITNLLITVFGNVVWVLLRTTVHGNGASREICDVLANISLTETKSDGSKNCTVRAQNCTIMDCTTVIFSNEQFPTFVEDINYSSCFGIHINDCNDSLSMDFYIQVPSRNLSVTLRITQDTEFNWTDLTETFGSNETFYPVFIFEFRKKNNSKLHISVTMSVNIITKKGEFPFQNVSSSLIGRQSIPLKLCNKTISTTDKTPNTFAPDICFFQPYITITPVDNFTLNMKCDRDKNLCGPKETCSMISNQSKCICAPQFKLNTNGDDCILSRKFNQTCENNEECDVDKVCTANQFNKSMICQCRPHYTCNQENDTCICQQQRNLTVTLNKKCDLGKNLCGPKEKCDMISNQSKCICAPQFKLNTNGDNCILSRKFNQSCENNEECDVDKVCAANQFNKSMICQCRTNYTYNQENDTCQQQRNLTVTLNKTCDLVYNLCGPNETCDMTLKHPKCICGLDFKLNAKEDNCIPSKRFNHYCESNDECADNEVCAVHELTKRIICQCGANYTYSVKNDTCIFQPQRDLTDTLNKTCDRKYYLCGPRQMCKLTLKHPICVCGPEFKLNSDQDSCIFIKSFNKSCEKSDDCDINEVCMATKLFKHFLCQCRENYDYSENMSMCIQTPKNSTDKPQKCTQDNDCGVRMKCDLTSQEPQCICKDEFKLNATGEGCIFSRRYNEPCWHDEECSINEHCTAVSGNNTFCQCVEGAAYSDFKEMCTLAEKKNPTVLILIIVILTTVIIIDMVVFGLALYPTITSTPPPSVDV